MQFVVGAIRSGGVTCAAVVVATLVVACVVCPAGATPARGATADALHEVTLQLRWDHQSQFAGYYAAQWQGFYAEQGLQVTIRPGVTSDGRILSAVEEVQTGSAEFGVGGADILIANDKGASLVILASIFQKSAAAFYALPETPLESVQDFTRLRVARNVNDLIDVELQAMLLAEGVNPESLQSYPLTPDVQSLLERAVDIVPGYTIAAPFVLKEAGVESPRVLRPTQFGVNFYGDTLFTTQAMVGEEPELTARFRRATVRGWMYALAHPDEMATRISAELSRSITLEDPLAFNRFQMEQLRDLTLHPTVPLGHVNPQRWAMMHAQLKDLGLVDGEFDEWATIYDPEARLIAEQEQLEQGLLIGVVALVAISAVVLLWVAALRKTVQERTRDLWESENKLRTLVEAAGAGVIMQDATGRIVLWNRAAATVFGMEAEDILGAATNSQACAIIHDDGSPITESEDPFRFTLHTGDPLRDVVMGARRGDSVCWLLMNTRPMRAPGDGGLLGVVITFSNITARKAAEAALRKERERFEAIANYTSDLEMWHGPNGRLVWVNPAVKTHTGREVAECMAMEGFPFPIIHEQDRDRLAREFEGALRNGGDTMNDCRFRLLRVSGETLWMSLSWTPIYNTTGEYQGLRSSARDISERVSMEHFREDLERVTRHDLRSPLAAALSGMQVLQRQTSLDEDQRQIVTMVERSCAHMLELIDRSLELYRLESGAYTPARESLALSVVFHEALHDLGDLVRQRGAEIQVRGEAYVLGERALCRSMLVNLLRNALEAMPARGGVVQAQLGAHQTEGVARIANPGEVPSDIRHTFFEKYATSGKARGTGLGAYSARMMARAMGGDARLIATGKGRTVIEVRLPLAAAAEAVDSHEAGQVPPASQG